MDRGYLSAMCALLILAGCATADVHSDWDASADFTRLKTYSWLSSEQPKTGDPRIDNSLLDSRIREAVDSELARKGYQKTETGTPDFWVSYHAAIQGKMDVTTFSSPYYSSPVVRPNGTLDYAWGAWGMNSQTMVTQYEEGTLMLDFADPATKRLIWRGTASGVADPSRSPAERTKRIRAGVEKILERFPPG